MGIFSKKKKAEEKTKVDSSTKSTFKGSLNNTKISSEKNTININREITKDEDSSDSVVILNKVQIHNDLWVCQECETRNQKTNNTCVVCGLKNEEK